MANEIGIGVPTTDIEAATKVGNNLDEKSDLFYRAFTLQETSSDTEKDTLAKLLDLKPSADGKPYSIEALQAAAQRVFDRASSSYSALTNLFRSKKQALDAVIQNIR